LQNRLFCLCRLPAVIYPSRHPVATPFTSAQLRRLPRHERNIRRKINKNIRKYRVYVEHVIRLLKVFKIIGSLYRHNRDEMGRIVCLCANLCARRSLLLFDPWCILKVRSVFKNKRMFIMFSYLRLCVVIYYLLRRFKVLVVCINAMCIII
jgi:hypothetical protein